MPQYITKTDAVKQLGVSSQKFNSCIEALKIKVEVSNRDNRVQLITEEDLEKIKKYLSR